MGNQCSGPNKAYLRFLRLAALNQLKLPLWRPLSLPYLRYTPTLGLRLLSKMHCDFLFCGRTGMEYAP